MYNVVSTLAPLFLIGSYTFLHVTWTAIKTWMFSKFSKQGAHSSGKSQENLFFLQGQGNVREFCKMVREIRKSSKVREKSGNFKIMFG